MKSKFLALVVLLASCAAPEVDETKVGAVSSIGSWYTMTGLSVTAFSQSPVFAKATGQGWTAFAWGNDQQYYVTTETFPGSGVFNASWQQISTGENWQSQPAVTVLANFNPPRFFVVGRNGNSNMRAQIQNQAGTVVYTAWHNIRPEATFHSGPSVAFHPAVGLSQNRIMLVARGADDRLYETRNLLVSGNYGQFWWTDVLPVSSIIYDSTPAVTSMCGNLNPNVYGFIAAARRPSDGGYDYYNFDGNVWGSAISAQNGLFQTGPALACAPGVPGIINAEISLWGVGLAPGNGLWYSTYAGGFFGFTGAGIAVQPGSFPTAAGYGNQLRIGARQGSNNITAPANAP